MKIITNAIAVMALLAMTVFAHGATLITEPEQPEIQQVFRTSDGVYTVTINGKSEPFPVEWACESDYEAAARSFKSDNHSDFHFRVTAKDGQLEVGGQTIKLVCPPPVSLAAMEAALKSRDFIDEKTRDALIAAYKDGHYQVIKVAVDTNTKIRVGDTPYTLWATPYGKRGSEINQMVDVRDNRSGEASLFVVTAGEKRLTILWDAGCQCGPVKVVTLAIGVKAKAVVTTKRSVKQFVKKNNVVKTSVRGTWKQIGHSSTMNCWGRTKVPRNKFRWAMCNGHWTVVQGGSVDYGWHRLAWKWVGTGRPKTIPSGARK